MLGVDLLFFLALFLFLYTWVLYPLLISVVGHLHHSKETKERETAIEWDGVSVILPVFNGEAGIVEKLRDLLATDYPGPVEVVVVSDGSTDGTVERAREIRDSRIKVLAEATNLGKSAAQNAGIRQSKFPFLLLTDVGCRMEPDALREMVRIAEECGAGCVGANVQYERSKYDRDDSSGFYWKVEERVRRAESKAGVLLSVCGSAILVRRAVFRELDHDTGDDFVIPMDVVLQGGKTKFAPGAIVHDSWPASTLRSEVKVRRRITLRNMLSVARRAALLNPFRFGVTSVSLLSHKVLRWLSPTLLMLALFASVVRLPTSEFYQTIVGVQVVVYVIGGLLVLLKLKGIDVPKTGFFTSFLVANYGMLLGIIAFFRGARVTAYDNNGGRSEARGGK